MVLKCTPYTMWKYFVPCWLETESQKNRSSKEKTKTQIKHKTKRPKTVRFAAVWPLFLLTAFKMCAVPGLWRRGEHVPAECGGRAWGVLLIYR